MLPVNATYGGVVRAYTHTYNINIGDPISKKEICMSLNHLRNGIKIYSFFTELLHEQIDKMMRFSYLSAGFAR